MTFDCKAKVGFSILRLGFGRINSESTGASPSQHETCKDLKPVALSSMKTLNEEGSL
jgi:hypothetical protein